MYKLSIKFDLANKKHFAIVCSDISQSTNSKLDRSSIEFAWLITIIICIELSDAKFGFHWDSLNLKPHLPVNKQIFKYFFAD